MDFYFWGLLLIEFSAHLNVHAVCFETHTFIHTQTYTHTHTHKWPRRNEQCKSFPIDSCFSLCRCLHWGYFTKLSLSPAFFNEMEIITVGEKPSTHCCQSESGLVCLDTFMTYFRLEETSTFTFSYWSELSHLYTVSKKLGIHAKDWLVTENTNPYIVCVVLPVKLLLCVRSCDSDSL